MSDQQERQDRARQAAETEQAVLALFGGDRRRVRQPNITDRDFRRPPPPAGEVQRALEELSQRFSEQMRAAMAAYLRKNLAFDRSPVEILPYADAQLAAGDSAWCVPLLAQSGDRAVLLLDEEMQSYLIGRLLGFKAAPDGEEEAEPEPADEEGEAEPIRIGPVSRAALKPFLATLLARVNQAMGEQIQSNPFHLDLSRVKNPAARMLRGGESVVSMAVSFRDGDPLGTIGILVQQRVVQEAIEAEREEIEPIGDPTHRGRLESVVRQVEMGLTAHLGSATVDLEEFMRLVPGDVLVLDRRIGEPLEISIGSQVQYTAMPGRSGGRVAVRILALNDPKESS